VSRPEGLASLRVLSRIAFGALRLSSEGARAGSAASGWMMWWLDVLTWHYGGFHRAGEVLSRWQAARHGCEAVLSDLCGGTVLVLLVMRRSVSDSARRWRMRQGRR
jgi:hypothetical protein